MIEILVFIFAFTLIITLTVCDLEGTACIVLIIWIVSIASPAFAIIILMVIVIILMVKAIILMVKAGFALITHYLNIFFAYITSKYVEYKKKWITPSE